MSFILILLLTIAKRFFFDSYAAPWRPSVDFRTVPGDVDTFLQKSPVKVLKMLSGRKEK